MANDDLVIQREVTMIACPRVSIAFWSENPSRKTEHVHSERFEYDSFLQVNGFTSLLKLKSCLARSSWCPSKPNLHFFARFVCRDHIQFPLVHTSCELHGGIARSHGQLRI